MKDAREKVKKFYDKHEEGLNEIHQFQLDNFTTKAKMMPIMTEYMDKSMKYSPEAIIKSMDKFVTQLKGNEVLFAQFKEQIIAAAIGISTLTMKVGAAHAEDGKPLPSGLVSYTKFLEGINDHVIERVRVAADGRTAEFINSEGVRGAV